MTKLTDLDPQFERINRGKVETLGEAHGIGFKCPVCLAHRVLVWFALPGCLQADVQQVVLGTGYSDLTIKAIINFEGSQCPWRGFISNGEVG